jgi:ribonuclease III
MDPLETVIDYKFSNPLLLAEALTHPSLAYETQKPSFDNQRLEFLGDAVLQLTVADELFRRLRSADEGVLSKARSQLVSEKGLAKMARQINLGAYLLIGRGEEASGGRSRDRSLADAFEALTAAIFLDGGLQAAKGFVARAFGSNFEALIHAPLELNPKGELQEIIQRNGNLRPVYAIVSDAGLGHQKSFEAVVSWRGVELGRGSAGSKQGAEIEAARMALSSPALKELLSKPEASSQGAPTSCA